MVRINLVHPRYLADQHLVAEYNEILMLVGYVRKYPAREGIPRSFLLGPGHIKFFKDKLLYLRDRHELIKGEMVVRGFRTDKVIDVDEFPSELHGDWVASDTDKQLIRDRITEKLLMKPEYYRYRGVFEGVDFFLDLIRRSS